MVYKLLCPLATAAEVTMETGMLCGVTAGSRWGMHGSDLEPGHVFCIRDLLFSSSF